MAFYSALYSVAEEAGTMQETYDQDRGLLSASVELRCAYTDRHLVCAEIVGGRLQWPKGVAAGSIVPKCWGASIRPVQTGSTFSAGSPQLWLPTQALITLQYSTKTTETRTESVEPTCEFITLDHRLFRWGAIGGDPIREEEAPGNLVRGINFVITKYYQTGPISSSYTSLMGSCNNAVMSGTILAMSFGVETLLYAPPSINARIDMSGAYMQEIQTRFTYKPQGWNTYYRSKTNAWTAIYNLAGTQHKSYPPANLTPVF